MKEHILAKILRFLIYITPFHVGKVVIFRSLVEAMLVLYLFLIWRDRSYLLKMTRVGLAFLFFALAFTVATIFSVIPYASFWGSLERMGGLFTFWHYFIYFIILTSLFKTGSQWLNLFKVAIFVGVLSALYGFGQRTNIEFFVGSGGRFRIFGTIGNPALFAGYQILTMFLALTLWFYKRDRTYEKILYGSAIILNTIAIFMTAVRGSLLAVVVGFLLFALLYSVIYRSRTGKNLLLGFIVLIILFIFSALLLKNSSFVKNSPYLTRVTEFSLTNYTVQTRFWAGEAGIKCWKENAKTVLLGWGPKNFNIPFAKYFNPKFFQGPGSETLFDRAHNMFVEILVTMGLAGLLSYLYIFATSLKSLWSKLKDRATAAFGVGLIPLVIAYAIHNSFIFDTSANFLMFFTILGFISFISNGSKSEPAAAKNKKRFNGGLWFFSLLIAIVVSAIFIYRVNVVPSMANYATTRGIVAGWSSDFAGAISKYREAIEYDAPGKYEYRHRLAQYLLEKGSSGKLSPEYVDALQYGIKELEKNVEENKVDYLPYLYLSRSYIILGKEDPNSEYNDKSLEYSLKALDLAPTFVRTYYEIAQAYLNKKDLDKATEYFKKAAEFNPDVGLSSWYWGVVEIERGNNALGLSIIENVLRSNKYTPSENEVGRLINIYLKIGDIDKVIWAAELLVKTKPDNPQYRASLATAYAQAGRIDDAVEQAREAARLDSKYESAAISFIRSLGREW